MNALVVAMVGTDHHPFERLVTWMDAAAVQHPDVHFVVQHGVSPAPVVAEGRAYLAHGELERLLARASVVVCHGGPGIVTEAREAGHLPLCVPRDPGFGEHVDDHQQRFADLVGRVGVVRVARTFQDFGRELDQALAGPPGLGDDLAGRDARDAARARAAAGLEELFTAGRQHVLGRRSHARS
ncbi:glycosyltransferase [Nocardioides sp. IC4_145]|uniref:glycosyltransferase n=1 Tax=Nocardioides sp. IC4_145 TaxID=2714037 RepID=UPI001A98FDCD